MNFNFNSTKRLKPGKTPSMKAKGRFIRQYSAFLGQLGQMAHECAQNGSKDGKEFFQALQTYYANKSNNCNSDPIVLSHAVITPLWGEIMHTAFGHTTPQSYSKLMDTINMMERRAREVLNEHERDY